ncbi:MAG: hypothetical protein KO464_05505 [Candidatus Methanofastidiosum sp.]|nr:hypothetical protein [Methanofastidiosum sp.]
MGGRILSTLKYHKKPLGMLFIFIGSFTIFDMISGREILTLIDGQEESFTLLLQQMKETFLDVSKHHRLFGTVVKAKFETKLVIELGNTDRREIDIGKLK